MDEKILIQYCVGDDPRFKKSAMLTCSPLIIGVLYAILGIVAGGSSAWVMIGLGVIFALLGVWMIVYMYQYMAKTSITVTPERVYGRVLRREVDMPMDSISFALERGKQQLTFISSVCSSAVVFTFYTPTKRDEVYQILSQELAQIESHKRLTRLQDGMGYVPVDYTSPNESLTHTSGMSPNEIFAQARSIAEAPLPSKTSKPASVTKRAIVGGILGGATGAIIGAASAIDKNNKSK